MPLEGGLVTSERGFFAVYRYMISLTVRLFFMEVCFTVLFCPLNDHETEQKEEHLQPANIRLSLCLIEEEQ